MSRAEKMLCNVAQPNSVIIEVEVDIKANGQECLDKVCEKLGIIEQDYFGLQYRGNKRENLWLNMRNRIDRQLPGPVPYRFQLRVKFFVQPHQLLQESTRHQFYLQIKQELQTEKTVMATEDHIVCMVALIAQAEYGNQNNNSYQQNLYNQLLHGIATSTPMLLEKIFTEHGGLRDMSQTTAEYNVLKLASELENYGMDYYEAKNSSGESLIIGVGPEGIFNYNTEMEFINKIEYPVIHMATNSGNRCVLEIFQETGDTTQLVYKLVSQKAANALYRCVTEMHSFFRCDTVHNAVSTQFSRDLKGTLASIFNENTSLGKNYVFDIKRTCREAYDYARRQLYTPVDSTQQIASGQETNKENLDCDNGNIDEQCKLLKDKLEKLQRSFICCVCMDSEITTALCPCGHVVVCSDCGGKLGECPLCRTEIDHVQRVYLPTAPLVQR